jgi:hypothetical protein
VNFLNPLFLFGLAAAAIPVLIHLFTRRKPREVRFPSLEFLAEVNQSEIRRLRLKQWLLLALRTLAVALLAMAMARPSMKGGAAGHGSAASTLIALVDVSGSMGAPDAEGRPLTATARRVVESLLATLGPADELLLVPHCRPPALPEPLADAARCAPPRKRWPRAPPPPTTPRRSSWPVVRSASRAPSIASCSGSPTSSARTSASAASSGRRAPGTRHGSISCH